MPKTDFITIQDDSQFYQTLQFKKTTSV